MIKKVCSKCGSVTHSFIEYCPYCTEPIEFTEEELNSFNGSGESWRDLLDNSPDDTPNILCPKCDISHGTYNRPDAKYSRYEEFNVICQECGHLFRTYNNFNGTGICGYCQRKESVSIKESSFVYPICTNGCAYAVGNKKEECGYPGWPCERYIAPMHGASGSINCHDCENGFCDDPIWPKNNKPGCHRFSLTRQIQIEPKKQTIYKNPLDIPMDKFSQYASDRLDNA